MKRKSWYSIIVGAVIISFGVTGYSIHKAQTTQKEQAMMFELKQLRDSVQIYMKTRNKKPENLSAVINEKYSFHTPEITVHLDSNGKAVDPFGKPYEFDEKTGWVRSGTEGYQTW